jgi:general secretion pathway protein G
MKKAFTMIELVFAIVIIGILSAIAIPRFAASRDDAQVAKGRSDVAAIRAAIVSERQTRLLKGDTQYIDKLDHQGASSTDGQILFDNNGVATQTLLQYGIASGSTNGHWRKTAANEYKYKVLGGDTTFTYTQASGTFDCNHADAGCKRLTE